MVLDAPTLSVLGRPLYVPKTYAGYTAEVFDIGAGDIVPGDVEELVRETYKRRLGIDITHERPFNPTGHVFALYYEGGLVTTGQAADPRSPQSDFTATMGAPFHIGPNTVEMTRVASRRTPVGRLSAFELLAITAGNYLKDLGVETAIGYSKPHMVDVAKRFLQSPSAGPIAGSDGGSYYVYEISLARSLPLANLALPSLSTYRSAMAGIRSATPVPA